VTAVKPKSNVTMTPLAASKCTPGANTTLLIKLTQRDVPKPVAKKESQHAMQGETWIVI